MPVLNIVQEAREVLRLYAVSEPDVSNGKRRLVTDPNSYVAAGMRVDVVEILGPVYLHHNGGERRKLTAEEFVELLN